MVSDFYAGDIHVQLTTSLKGLNEYHHSVHKILRDQFWLCNYDSQVMSNNVVMILWRVQIVSKISEMTEYTVKLTALSNVF